jgi:hypothetical protein
MIALSGVRSSWLIFARKRALTWFAASAALSAVASPAASVGYQELSFSPSHEPVVASRASALGLWYVTLEASEIYENCHQKL